MQMFATVPHLKLIAHKWIYSSEAGRILYQRKSVAKTRMPVIQVLNTTTPSPQAYSWFIQMSLIPELSNRLKKSAPEEAA